MHLQVPDSSSSSGVATEPEMKKSARGKEGEGREGDVRGARKGRIS